MRPPDRIQALRPVAGPAPRRLSGRPVRQRGQVPRRCHRRAKNLPVGSYYGEPRASWACACSPIRHSTRPPKWDAERFYNDPDYYNSGTSCAPTGSACPAAAMSARARSPRRTIPRIRNGRTSTRRWAPSISGSTASSPGTIRRRTACQLVHTQRPGTLDTSLVSTDYINNPRTMNAIYNLGPRRTSQAMGCGDSGGRRAEQQAVQ